MKRNITTKFPLIIALFAPLILTSCGGNGSKEVINETTLKLNVTSMNLVIGDITRLVPSYTPNDVDSLTWESTNKHVISVSEEGKIEALRSGDGYVIARYGKLAASCYIRVSAESYIPTLHFVNEVDSEEAVAADGSLNLATYISFNGRKFYDAEVNYQISNPDAGSMENDVFKASSNIGETTSINVTATWRDYDLPSLYKNIDVTIGTIKNIYLNGGRLSSINLNTVDHIGEVTYKTSQDIESVEAFVNKNKVDIKSVEVINNHHSLDDSLPAVEFTFDKTTLTGRVDALREGTATLKASFIDLDGSEYIKPFPITVNMPIYNIDETITNFSIKDGAYYDEANDEFVTLDNLFPTGTKTILRAYQEDRELTIEDNKIMNVLSSANASSGNATVRLFNDVMGVEVNLVTYTKIITKAEDFIDIYSDPSTNKVVTGYYALMKDIDSSSPLMMESGYKPTTFKGVFDGNGHSVRVTIKHNTASEEWGLFGKTLSGTVKRLAINGSQTNNGLSGIVSSVCGDGASLEDVYIRNYTSNEFDSTTFNVMYNTYGYLKTERVIVDAQYEIESLFEKGCFGVHRNKNTSKDTYIISSEYLSTYTNRRTYASESLANADTTSGITTKFYWYGTKQYEDFDAMAKDNNSYSNFVEDIWDLSTGIPVFKGLNYYLG